MGDWGRLNQKQKRAVMRRVQADEPGLEVVYPNAVSVNGSGKSKGRVANGGFRFDF
jgi:hypothetical protein